MSLDQDDETIYADFDADAYNDLIEYQFRNIVKLMSGLEMGESIQEKVLKELTTNLASLMVMENWKDEAGWSDYSTNPSQSDTLQVKPHHSCKILQIVVYIGFFFNNSSEITFLNEDKNEKYFTHITNFIFLSHHHLVC